MLAGGIKLGIVGAVRAFHVVQLHLWIIAGDAQIEVVFERLLDAILQRPTAGLRRFRAEGHRQREGDGGKSETNYSHRVRSLRHLRPIVK